VLLAGAAYEHIFYEQRLDYKSILSRSGRAVAARQQPVETEGREKRSKEDWSICTVSAPQFTHYPSIIIRAGKGWECSGRSEVPTQRDRPTQSASMHVSHLRRALRRVLCLNETEIRLSARLSEAGFLSH